LTGNTVTANADEDNDSGEDSGDENERVRGEDEEDEDEATEGTVRNYVYRLGVHLVETIMFARSLIEPLLLSLLFIVKYKKI
jgi:hypothetical protein